MQFLASLLGAADNVGSSCLHPELAEAVRRFVQATETPAGAASDTKSPEEKKRGDQP